MQNLRTCSRPIVLIRVSQRNRTNKMWWGVRWIKRYILWNWLMQLWGPANLKFIGKVGGLETQAGFICYSIETETLLLWKTLLKKYLFIYLFIYLFLERGERREKEKERNISMWLPLALHSWGPGLQARHHALTGNWTSNPLACRPALSLLSHTSQCIEKPHSLYLRPSTNWISPTHIIDSKFHYLKSTDGRC